MLKLVIEFLLTWLLLEAAVVGIWIAICYFARGTDEDNKSNG